MSHRTRRRLAIAVFAVFGTAFLVGTHHYLALRLVIDPGLAGAPRALALAAIAALGATLVLQPIGERTLPHRAARWLAWPASLWMGAAFWLLLGLLATDALAWIAAAGFGALPFASEAGAALRAAGVAAATLAAVGFGLRSGLAPPRVVYQRYAIAGWPRALDGFRIVQVSDVHIGPILDRRFAAEVARRVDALEPDLIAVTGDLVDGSARLLADEVAPFGEMRARHGVFFVTGNHDHYSGAASWLAVVEKLGMRPLRNERVAIGAGADGFDLVGVDDHRAHLVGDERSDLARALAGRDPSRPAVLLAHDPATFDQARRAGVDLQLSGHTHGGQIWPFRWFVRLATPYVAGRFRAGRAQLYVSRGTGFWGPPLRLGAPAEITVHELHAADA